MAKGPARRWRDPAPHTSECLPYVHAALAAGHGNELTITGVPGGQRAAEIRRGLFNAARMRTVSVHVKVTKQRNGTYTITYATHDKGEARGYVLARYGTDRTAWPYNPRAAIAREPGDRS
jgi:hypothetical protein